MPEIKNLTALYFLILFTVISLAVTSTIFPQTKSNLEIFYSLADSSVNSFIHSNNPNGNVYTELNNGGTYSVFNSHILGLLQAKGIKPISGKGTDAPQYLYSVIKASTIYGDVFRDGFLGDFLVKRELVFTGNYFYTGAGLKEFNLLYTDTVKVEDIKNLENTSFNFTVGIVPTEPFFSGLFEPIAALGTAAVAVILFFTVRSR
jgi:hypothetical protein